MCVWACVCVCERDSVCVRMLYWVVHVDVQYVYGPLVVPLVPLTSSGL